MAYKNPEDQRRASREHYYNNKESYLEKNYRRRRATVELIASLKEKCELCGFSNPAALEYHHKDGRRGDVLIADLPNKGWSKEKVLQEISKCRILCANCHRVLHYSAG